MRFRIVLVAAMLAFTAVVVASPPAAADCVTDDTTLDVCFSCPGEARVWVLDRSRQLFECV